MEFLKRTFSVLVILLFSLFATIESFSFNTNQKTIKELNSQLPINNSPNYINTFVFSKNINKKDLNEKVIKYFYLQASNPNHIYDKLTLRIKQDLAKLENSLQKNEVSLITPWYFYHYTEIINPILGLNYNYETKTYDPYTYVDSDTNIVYFYEYLVLYLSLYLNYQIIDMERINWEANFDSINITFLKYYKKYFITPADFYFRLAIDDKKEYKKMKDLYFSYKNNSSSSKSVFDITIEDIVNKQHVIEGIMIDSNLTSDYSNFRYSYNFVSPLYVVGVAPPIENFIQNTIQLDSIESGLSEELFIDLIDNAFNSTQTVYGLTKKIYAKSVTTINDLNYYSFWGDQGQDPYPANIQGKQMYVSYYGKLNEEEYFFGSEDTLSLNISIYNESGRKLEYSELISDNEQITIEIATIDPIPHNPRYSGDYFYYEQPITSGIFTATYDNNSAIIEEPPIINDDDSNKNLLVLKILMILFFIFIICIFFKMQKNKNK